MPQRELREATQIAEVRALILSGEAKRIRVTSGLPIGDAARAIGVNPATLWRYEHNERLPRGIRAVRYHALLSRLRRAAS